MRVLNKLLNERVARKVAGFIEIICYVLLLICILGLVASIIGRQEVNVHTSTGGTYNRVILADEHNNWRSSWRNPSGPGFRWVFVVASKDTIHIETSDTIDITTKIAVSTTYAMYAIPLIISFWLLSRVFRNVRKGQIFINQNAAYLLYFGLIQIVAALLAPFINLGIIHIADQLSTNSISIATGEGMFNQMLPNIAAIVAAYIIHYGVSLQDEADHTL